MAAERDGGWRSAVADVVRVLRIIAPSLALVVLGFFAIAAVSQSVEAVRVLVEDAASGHPGTLIAFLCATVFCGLTAWYWARVLIYLRYYEQPDETGSGKWAARQLPRFAGVIPPMACAVVAYRAMGSSGPNSKGADLGLGLLALSSIGIAVALYVFFAVRRRWLTGDEPQSTLERRVTARGLPIESRTILVVTASLWFVLLVLIAATYGAAVRGMGPLGILLVSIGTWITAVSIVYYAGRLIRLPLISIGALAVFVFSCVNVNDNHLIRHSIDATRPLPERYDSAFAHWLDNRQDRAEQTSYPVFFVATEGGGLRAAYFTSLVLSAIQDRCPAFAQHVFAISSVSGGSVGAGLFAASVSREARNAPAQPCAQSFTSPGHHQRQVDSVLQRDFLTPLFAQALYPDLLQRGLPFRVGAFDRARALERGLESAWHDVTGGDELAGSFYGLWKDFAHGATPALFLNTTRVETGARMVESNLLPVGDRFDHLVSLADVNSRLDLPLSTAVGLSGRFPIVTPIGGIPVGEQGWFGGNVNRYTDGGYFDDSGASTVMELISSLHPGEPNRGAGRRPRFTPIVIRIGFEVKGSQAGDTTRNFRSNGLNEVLSPIRTLLNTRDARAATAVEQLRSAIDVLQDHGVATELIEFQLTQDKVPLVLGWLLSGQARQEMTTQFGPAHPCADVHEVENACSYQRVVDLLTNGVPITKRRR